MKWYGKYLKGGNKKVRNATKTVIDGHTFDSKLESHMYALLRMHKIKFEMQKEYLLLESFTYRSETVRPMIMTIDFYLPEIDTLIETKGFADEKYKVKLKWLKWTLKTAYKIEPDYIEVKNKKECDSLILKILSLTKRKI